MRSCWWLGIVPVRLASWFCAGALSMHGCVNVVIDLDPCDCFTGSYMALACISNLVT